MGKNIRNKCLFSLAFIVAGVLFQGCKDEVFNPEKVKAAYQDRFPVKDIDPDMDWRMTNSISIHVTVNLDTGTDYSIRIYDDDPLTESSTAHLLAEGTANNTMAFLSTMDCPINLTAAYVCLTDAANCSVVKLCSIENGSLQTSFGISPEIRAATRATKNGITTYSPDRTEAQIKALSATAQELNENIVLAPNGVYKISQGTTYRGGITNYGISGNIATVIIEGTWEPKNKIRQIESGVDLVVTGTGKIILPSNGNNYPLSLNGNSRLLVFQGGAVIGVNKTGSIYLPTASNGRLNYNAGTIQANLLQVDGSNNIFYNSGNLEVNTLQISNAGSKLVNQGQVTLTQTGGTNGQIENGCRLTVTQQLDGNLIMGNNTSAQIGNYGSGGNWGKAITMGANSMLTITGNVYLSGITITGPQSGSALMRTGTLTGLNGFKHNGGHIYYEVQNKSLNDLGEGAFLRSLLNTNGMLSKWGESPIYIPAGECNGDGNLPTSGSGTSTTDESITYTYAFEDNFPMVGDYDFNDIALDVQILYQREKKTNAVKAIQINVSLAAAGASRTVGAGLRIVDIPQTAIRNIRAGGDYLRFQETLTSPRTGKRFFSYNSSTRMEDNGNSNEVIIPLFNDEHQVFGVEQGVHVNTASTENHHADGVKAYTYEIIIELADQTKQTPLFSKDNLDFFICYQYQYMQKRMEVHLYEFKQYGATSSGMTMQTNLDLAGNNTWAICVPNFRYPKELVNISISSNPSAGAYPRFLDWARNRNTNTDWYLHPNENNVYR